MRPRNGNFPNSGEPRPLDLNSDSPLTFDYIVPVDLGLSGTDRNKALRDIRLALQKLGFIKVPTVSITEVGTYEEALGQSVDPTKVKYITNHGVYDLHVSVVDMEGQPGRESLVAFLDQLHARHTQPVLLTHSPVNRDGVMALADLERGGLGRGLEFKNQQ